MKTVLKKLFLNQTDILSLYKRPESDSSSSSSLVASSVSGKTSNLISTTQMQESSTPQQMTAAYSFDSFDDQYGQMQPYVYSMLCGSLSDTKPYACVNHQQTQQTQPQQQHLDEIQLLDLDENKFKPRYKKFKADLITSHLKSV